jgi:hypothetical protein
MRELGGLGVEIDWPGTGEHVPGAEHMTNLRHAQESRARDPWRGSCEASSPAIL